MQSRSGCGTIFDGTALLYVACQSHSGSFLRALSSSAPTIVALSKNAMPAMYAIFSSVGKRLAWDPENVAQRAKAQITSAGRLWGFYFGVF
jgi:hypothetical protein